MDNQDRKSMEFFFDDQSLSDLVPHMRMARTYPDAAAFLLESINHVLLRSNIAPIDAAEQLIDRINPAYQQDDLGGYDWGTRHIIHFDVKAMESIDKYWKTKSKEEEEGWWADAIEAYCDFLDDCQLILKTPSRQPSSAMPSPLRLQ